ncbi:MAG TPA: hypothetical protein VFE15_16895 [Marmoricola sp.]|nr:hypothetical protein [Marmoricola sp.]
MDDNTKQCTNCGATMSARSTYCLECDTPVSPEEPDGLSVAESHVTKTGKPIVAISIFLAIVVVLVGATYGVMGIVKKHARSQVSANVVKGVQVLVHSEDGFPAACRFTDHFVAGPEKTTKPPCVAIASDDPGALFKRLHVTSTTYSGSHGTVTVRGTLNDNEGSRVMSLNIKVVKVAGTWYIDWDGSPLVKR